MKVLTIAAAMLLLAQNLPAQKNPKNLVPASQSSLTGITLPQGSREDKRLLVRASAKTLMDMEAKTLGVELGSRYEVYLLPPSEDHDLSTMILTDAENKGWTLTIFPTDIKWGWLQRDQRRILIHFEGDRRESWLYFAEVAYPQPATAVAGTPRGAPTGQTLPQPAVYEAPPPANPAPVTPAAAPGSYTFTTTNYEDGWTATERPAWVEFTKGPLRVLLHLADAMPPDHGGQTPVIMAHAWNVLVAPRYKAMSDYFAFDGNMSHQKSAATVATLTEPGGQQRYVVLYRQGGGPFLEFIAPDKASFVQAFGMDIHPGRLQELIWSDDRLWGRMAQMANLNRFAVAPADLTGEWMGGSGAAMQYYYTGTGNYAGMNATAISDRFIWNGDGSYMSEHKGASGMVGNQQFFQNQYKGRSQMNGNWEISLTNRQNGRTDTFSCAFEVVRGGRVLHLQHRQYSGIGYQLVRKVR